MLININMLITICAWRIVFTGTTNFVRCVLYTRREFKTKSLTLNLFFFSHIFINFFLPSSPGPRTCRSGRSIANEMHVQCKHSRLQKGNATPQSNKYISAVLYRYIGIVCKNRDEALFLNHYSPHIIVCTP